MHLFVNNAVKIFLFLDCSNFLVNLRIAVLDWEDKGEWRFFFHRIE